MKGLAFSVWKLDGNDREALDSPMSSALIFGGAAAIAAGSLLSFAALHLVRTGAALHVLPNINRGLYYVQGYGALVLAWLLAMLAGGLIAHG